MCWPMLDDKLQEVDSLTTTGYHDAIIYDPCNWSTVQSSLEGVVGLQVSLHFLHEGVDGQAEAWVAERVALPYAVGTLEALYHFASIE